MRTGCLGLALALVLAGCGGSFAYAPVSAPPHAMTARTPESVELILDKAPDRAFVAVGTIESRDAADADEGHKTSIVRRMRFDAAERGCDGLLLFPPNGATAGGFRATCIVYRDSGPGPAPATMSEAPQHPQY